MIKIRSFLALLKIMCEYIYQAGIKVGENCSSIIPKTKKCPTININEDVMIGELNGVSINIKKLFSNKKKSPIINTNELNDGLIKRKNKQKLPIISTNEYVQVKEYNQNLIKLKKVFSKKQLCSDHFKIAHSILYKLDLCEIPDCQYCNKNK